MAETRNEHQFVYMSRESQWSWRPHCSCGWDEKLCFTEDSAINAWGDHLWFMDQQNLPDVLAG